MRRFIALTIAMFSAAMAFMPKADAQEYPSRPVRLIVPYAPGGPTDVIGRLIALRLADRWGQQVVVDNRPGANANIGAELAAKSAPDGYTLFLGTGSTHGTNPSVYRNLGFDPIRDFAPIVGLTENVVYLGVSASRGFASVKELVEYARANPGKLNYGSVGAGSAHHLAGELLRARAGIDLVHVPYKGSAPARLALQAGEIDVLFDSGLVAEAKSGRIRVLAVSSRMRWPASPEVPTMIEAGVPDFEARGWFALFAPAGSPPAAIARVNRDVNEILRMPDVRDRIVGMGAQPTGGTAAALGEQVRREIEYWRSVVQAAKITAE